MCWAFFGCCDKLFTIKSFDSSTLARNWGKLKSTPNTTPADHAISLWNGDILVYGSKNTAALTNEGVLVTRDVSSGSPSVYSTSTPLTAIDPTGGVAEFSVDANASDGAWLLSADTAMYWDPAALDGPIALGASVSVDVDSSSRQKLFYQTSSSVISGKNSTTIAKWDSGGSETASLATSALSLTSGYSLSGSAFAIETRASDPVLFYGRETNGSQTLRRIWQVDTSLSEVAAVTGGTDNDFTYSNTDSIYNKPWTPDGNYAFLKTSTGIQRIDLATLAFGWHNTDNTIDHILCADNSNVYVVYNFGISKRLRAISVSTGSTVWSQTSGTFGASARARVTTAGLALWNSNSVLQVRLYSTSTGSLIDSFDNDGATVGGLKKLMEHDGSIYVAGVQRS